MMMQLRDKVKHLLWQTTRLDIEVNEHERTEQANKEQEKRQTDGNERGKYSDRQTDRQTAMEGK